MIHEHNVPVPCVRHWIDHSGPEVIFQPQEFANPISAPEGMDANWSDRQNFSRYSPGIGLSVHSNVVAIDDGREDEVMGSLRYWQRQKKPRSYPAHHIERFRFRWQER